MVVMCICELLLPSQNRRLRRMQQEIRARLGANATEAQISKAMQEASGAEDVSALFAVSKDDDAAQVGLL